MYITVQDIKKHLNIDFNEDDTYIADLIEAAEDYIRTYCNRPLEELAEGNTLRPAVKHAVRLLVGHWYNSREAVAFSTPSELPFGLAAILIPMKKY